MSDENEQTPAPLTGRQKGEAEVQKRWGNRGEDGSTGSGEKLTGRAAGLAEVLKRFGK